MSQDFRKRIYDAYVSEFKQSNAHDSGADIAEFERWSDARYLPQFKNLDKSAAILDLGCGHGRMLRYLRAKGYSNAIGVDASAEQIAIARAEGLNAEVGDIIEYLESHPNAFDLIIGIDVVEHFTKDELFNLFDLLSAALRQSGLVLLQTANGEGLFPGHIIYGDLSHCTILSPGSMEQLLRVTGFDGVRFAECSPVPMGTKGEFRAAAWSLITSIANSIRRIECGKTQEIWTENFIASARKKGSHLHSSV